MPEQSKFENMDLFASLEAIMKQNTGFYQSDLDIDKEIIAKAAASPNREDKTFCGSAARPGRTVSGSTTFSSKIPRPTTHGVSTWSRQATAFLPMQSS